MQPPEHNPRCFHYTKRTSFYKIVEKDGSTHNHWAGQGYWTQGTWITDTNVVRYADDSDGLFTSRSCELCFRGLHLLPLSHVIDYMADSHMHAWSCADYATTPHIYRAVPDWSKKYPGDFSRSKIAVPKVKLTTYLGCFTSAVIKQATDYLAKQGGYRELWPEDEGMLDMSHLYFALERNAERIYNNQEGILPSKSQIMAKLTRYILTHLLDKSSYPGGPLPRLGGE